MGMYTELIFGAALKKDTPPEVIELLKYMIGDRKDRPGDSPQVGGNFEWIFKVSSYYFAINQPVCRMWFDDISNQWRISARSNVKNYGFEIQDFLEWILPYIEYGSGKKDMYAIVTYEEDEEPTIYYMHNTVYQ